MKKYIHPFDKGFAIYLSSCDCSILKHLLDTSVPYVWIRGFSPHHSPDWWDVSLPLSKDGPPCHLKARNVVFDIQMKTEEFLSCLGQFADAGVELYQINRPVTDTLTFDHVRTQSRRKVLIQNGVTAGFVLPHRNEVAMFWAIDEECIQRALRCREVEQRAIESSSVLKARAT